MLRRLGVNFWKANLLPGCSLTLIWDVDIGRLVNNARVVITWLGYNGVWHALRTERYKIELNWCHLAALMPFILYSSPVTGSTVVPVVVRQSYFEPLSCCYILAASWPSLACKYNPAAEKRDAPDCIKSKRKHRGETVKTLSVNLQKCN